MKTMFATGLILAAAIAAPAAAAEYNPQFETAPKYIGTLSSTPAKTVNGQVSASRVDRDRPTLSIDSHRAKGTNGAYRRLQRFQSRPAK